MYRTTKTEDTEAFVRQRGKPRKTKTQSNLPAWHDQRCQLGTMTIRKARPQKKGGKGRKFRLQK